MIAFAVAFTASLFRFVVSSSTFEVNGSWLDRTVLDIALLVFGLLLVASHPVRSGITLGTGQHRSKVLTAMAIIIGGVLAYRLIIGVGAFDGWSTSWSIWAISPVAQELVFSGFILGLLNEHFPRWWHPSLPLTGAVVLSAALFGMWHFIPDLIFDDGDWTWLLFRQAYTAIPWMLYAMTRLWTGTILYAVIMHVIANFITFGL